MILIIYEDMSSPAMPVDENTVLPLDQVPLRRPGHMTDMGGLILFLASKAGAYMNGDVSVIDGGRLSIGCATY